MFKVQSVTLLKTSEACFDEAQHERKILKRFKLSPFETVSSWLEVSHVSF
jgi:hypothetical protein